MKTEVNNELASDALLEENLLREEKEKLSAQWGSRDAILRPIAKIRAKLLSRKDSLEAQRQRNDETIKLLTISNQAIQLESAMIVEDLEKIGL